MSGAEPTGTTIVVGGPYFEDLTVGDRYDAAPALTLTEGHAALHQAIVGDRLRLALDADLSERVLGAGRRLAHPLLVCDVAIGQSTLATQRVIANLFYRRLVLLRAPQIGDTLRTSTEIVALRRNRPREGRVATGLAVLRVRTVDQHAREILDFWRCAMLPLRDEASPPGRDDDLDAFGADLPADLTASLQGWDLGAFRAAVPGAHFADLSAPARWELEGGDTVTSAPELARLSLNVAKTHTDPAASRDGRRLVYGGHTIGMAAAALTRALPNLVSILGWHECRHLAPVMEGDVLHTVVSLERVEPLAAGGGLAHLRCEVQAHREDGARDAVLDWRLVGAFA